MNGFFSGGVPFHSLDVDSRRHQWSDMDPPSHILVDQ